MLRGKNNKRRYWKDLKRKKEIKRKNIGNTINKTQLMMKQSNRILSLMRI